MEESEESLGNKGCVHYLAHNAAWFKYMDSIKYTFKIGVLC